jgi:ComF family protein
MFNFLDIFFPRSNKNFTSISQYLSVAEIQALRPKLKPLTKKQRKYLEAIYIGSDYQNELIQDLMNRVKFEHETAILPEFAKLLHQKIYEEADYFIPSPDIIIPVAADPKRELQRGYSIPYKIASDLSVLTRSRVENILIKTKTTDTQTSLNRKQRLINLSNVFTLETTPNFANEEIVWLIDDICTTGTTLMESAKQIKKAYPFLKVYGIAVAGN